MRNIQTSIISWHHRSWVPIQLEKTLIFMVSSIAWITKSKEGTAKVITIKTMLTEFFFHKNCSKQKQAILSKNNIKLTPPYAQRHSRTKIASENVISPRKFIRPTLLAPDFSLRYFRMLLNLKIFSKKEYYGRNPDNQHINSMKYCFD